MNVFVKPETANSYDAYYQTAFGKKVDELEQRVISSFIKDIPRDSMLELGCGTGHWSGYFIKQGFNITGVDISEAMLQLAKAKELKAEFMKADSQKLPFRNESYTVISSINMLEFVDNQDKVLQEIYRILKPEGWLILGCLNAHSVLGERKELDETFRDAQFLTSEELSNKLQLFGEPKLKFGVYLTSNFNILDETPGADQVNPVFIAVIVQKAK